MRNTLLLFTVLNCLLCYSNAAVAQETKNDGFYRRDGQMHLLRNGQLRPMTRDSRLPTGLLITKDGFVVDAKGGRTELREGQGCDLKGNVLPIVTAKSGSLALANRPARSAAVPVRQAEEARGLRSVLDDLLGGQGEDVERDDDEARGKAWGKRMKQEKKRKGRGRGKGKKWDD